MLALDENKILQYYIDKVDLESNPIVPSIHILLESVSTNSEMKDFLKQGVLPEGAVFLTDYQTFIFLSLQDRKINKEMLYSLPHTQLWQ